jgi:glycosyltransferase involved in cell wall biosynthesis
MCTYGPVGLHARVTRNVGNPPRRHVDVPNVTGMRRSKGTAPRPSAGARPREVSRKLRVLALSARDSGHPEGGGAELYLETVLADLVARGHHVTMLTSRYPGSPRRSERDGYAVLRAGGRFTVYLRALVRMVLRRGGRFDVVVDVQNGMPFLSRLLTRRPVVLLCHHVHREQWPIALGGTRTGRLAARFGWFVESRVAPRVYRRCRYVTVSEHSADDLVDLGVRRSSITVVHNGAPPVRHGVSRSATPEIVVLGRLVPHKQVEHALQTVAELTAAGVRDLRLTVVGQGWWEPAIRAEVDRLGLATQVQLTGYVDEDQKHELLSRAWLSLTPSVKEGWGLCVIEAAAHGTPTVAYRAAGGVAESIVDATTGFLADSHEQLTRQVEVLIRDAQLRTRMGTAARLHAASFTWAATTAAFADVLQAATGGRPVASSAEVLPLPRPAAPLDDLLVEGETVGATRTTG